MSSIAGWRSRLRFPDEVPGLDPRPETTTKVAQWEDLQEHLAFTRTWLATTDRIEAQETPTTSIDELLDRRADLQQILDAAPADWRHVLAELRAGQLSLDDTNELLGEALDGQADRRAWILQH